MLKIYLFSIDKNTTQMYQLNLQLINDKERPYRTIQGVFIVGDIWAAVNIE